MSPVRQTVPGLSAAALEKRVLQELSQPSAASLAPPRSQTEASAAVGQGAEPVVQGAEPVGQGAEPVRARRGSRVIPWLSGVRRRTIERLLHDTFARVELWKARAELDELREQRIELDRRVSALGDQRDGLSRHVSGLEARLSSLESELQFQRRRLLRLSEGPADAEPRSPARPPPEGPFDGLEVAFLARTGLPPQQERLRLSPLLERLRRAWPAHPGRPLADLATGRGIWLGMTQAAGFPGYGVDGNVHVEQDCRRRGLEVRHADPLDHLAALPDELLGAITALNLVERLPLQRLLKLLEEGRRTLIAGGVLLLTTADADDTGGHRGSFHDDPRRRQPVPLVQLSFLVEKAGFSQLDSFLLPAPASGPAEIALVAIKT